jgi:SAM-dependent methyltransferase
MLSCISIVSQKVMTRLSTKMHQLHLCNIHARLPIYSASSRSSLKAPITSQLGSTLRTSSITAAVGATPFSRHFASPSTTICNSYAAPEVYDIAFSFRDFESEVAFLLAAYQTHSTGPLNQFLEVGCGPARHSILLSQATGATCIGLDSSKEMLAYAAQQAQQANLSAEKVKFVRGDMASPHGIAALNSEKVDVAAIMLGTLSHCLTNGAALACFNNIAEVVRPGGILILELSHPGELFGGSFLDPLDFVDCWEVSEDGDVEFAEKRSSNFQHGDEMDPEQQAAAENEGKEEELDDDDDEDDKGNDEYSENFYKNSKLGDGVRRVLVEYGREGDDFDPATQILERTVGFSLFSKEGELVSSDVSVVPQRQFSLQEVDLLARASGKWVVKAVYGNLDVNCPLDGEDAYRMVVVLQREL